MPRRTSIAEIPRLPATVISTVVPGKDWSRKKPIPWNEFQSANKVEMRGWSMTEKRIEYYRRTSRDDISMRILARHIEDEEKRARDTAAASATSVSCTSVWRSIEERMPRLFAVPGGDVENADTSDSE